MDKKNTSSENLQQLISLLNQVLELQNLDKTMLDPFQESVVKALKDSKMKQINKPPKSTPLAPTNTEALERLQKLVYLEKVQISFVKNEIIRAQNTDENDIFRLIFFSLAMNFMIQPEEVKVPFTKGKLENRLDHFHLIRKPTTKIEINHECSVDPNDSYDIVLQTLQQIKEKAQKFNGDVQKIAFEIVKKLQTPVVDLAVVSYIRAIVYEAPSDNTPPFEQLKIISSEYDAKMSNKKLLLDWAEFWWKVSNAVFSYVYFSEETLQPKKMGYPRIVDGQIQFPDLYFLRESGEVKLKFSTDFKPKFKSAFTKPKQH